MSSVRICCNDGLANRDAQQQRIIAKCDSSVLSQMIHAHIYLCTRQKRKRVPRLSIKIILADTWRRTAVCNCAPRQHQQRELRFYEISSGILSAHLIWRADIYVIEIRKPTYNDLISPLSVRWSFNLAKSISCCFAKSDKMMRAAHISISYHISRCDKCVYDYLTVFLLWNVSSDPLILIDRYK